MWYDILSDSRAVFSEYLTKANFNKLKKPGIRFFHKPCSVVEIYGGLDENSDISDH